MDIKKLFINLFRIIFIVAILFMVYQILRIVIGGSWESENIIIAGMGIILAGMFVVVGFLINQGKSLGILEERTKNIVENLSRLGKDFKEHLTKYDQNQNFK